MRMRRRCCQPGERPDLYAEAPVRVCKWSTESPLPRVAGVTGGALKRRIERMMNARDVPGLSFVKKAVLKIAGVAVLMAPVLVGIGNAPAILAQTPSGVPQWQIDAGGHMAFDVASVKLLKPGAGGRDAYFALDAGDGFRTHSGENPHGRFSATFALPVYIGFAYKFALTPQLRQAMVDGLPKWVDTDVFDIEAKAAGNPTKDQMRLMMQSLLAERFHLAVHLEARETPVFVLTLIKPGTWGPKLIRHADGPPCDVSGRQDPATGMSDAGDDVFPPRCETQASVLGKNGRMVQGSRNTTMALFAGSLGRTAGRPVVDRTGITDRIDYRLEWTLDDADRAASRVQLENLVAKGAIARMPPDIDDPDPDPVTLPEAVRKQLGLKLESAKAPVQTLVIDRIERPSEN